jgi:transglutaminase-like putative cysteine protease
MERRTLIVAGVGAAVVVTGVVLYVRSRRKKELLGRNSKILGRPQKKSAPRETVESGGMVLKHHRSRKMPIKERVGILQDLTHKSVQDPEMRKLALQITRGCQARDGECEARAIYNWTKSNVRYSGDVGPHKLGRGGPVEGIDLFQTAARTVDFGAGDCDDASILNCTLALHNGLACKYRVTGPAGREEFTHIYAMVGLPKNAPKKWIALDTTLPHGKLGTEAPYGRRLDFVA